MQKDNKSMYNYFFTKEKLHGQYSIKLYINILLHFSSTKLLKIVYMP